MLRDRVLHYAHKLGVTLKEHDNGRGWIEGNCPFAQWTHAKGHDNSMSFAISLTDSKSHFTCLACGEKGSMSTLAFRLGAFRKQDYKALGREIDKYELENRPARNVPDWDAARTAEVYEIPYIDESRYPPCYYHPYLKTRGISMVTAHRLGLRYDFAEQRILFPVVDYQGILYGYTGRLVANVCNENVLRVQDYYGLKKRLLFLGEHLATQERFRKQPLIIVEGLFDYAKLVEAGFPNTLALLGTEITREKYEKLELFDRPIIWMLDNDQGGEKTLYGKIDRLTNQRDHSTGALTKLHKKLPQRIVQYPNGINDPGECSVKLVKNLIASAKIYS